MLLQSPCIKCGAAIDYEPEQRNQTISCPSCQQPTPLWPQPTNSETRSDDVFSRWYIRVLLALSCVVIVAFTGMFLTTGNRVADLLMGPAMLCGAVAGLLFYFLPSVIGRRKKNATAICLLNLFLGWTFLGWVGALVWASMKD